MVGKLLCRLFGHRYGTWTHNGNMHAWSQCRRCHLWDRVLVGPPPPPSDDPKDHAERAKLIDEAAAK